MTHVLRERLKGLTRVRCCFGYRRLHVFLWRECNAVTPAEFAQTLSRKVA